MEDCFQKLVQRTFEKSKDGQTYFRTLDPDIALAKNYIISLENSFAHFKTPEEKASLYCTLAGIFAYYSSSHIFGMESQSPTALREFAVALLNRTLTLKKEEGAFFDVSSIQNWKEVLLGLNGRFTCTAILSSTIFSFCKENCPNIYHTLVPLSWR